MQELESGSARVTAAVGAAENSAAAQSEAGAYTRPLRSST
jgi:hypothetical protein